MPQCQQHLTLGRQLDPVLGDRRTQRVAADTLQVVPRTRGHPHGRIEIDATDRGMTGTSHHRQRRLVGQGAAALDRRAAPRPQRHPSLHRRRRQPRHHGLVVRPRIGDGRLGLLSRHAPPHEHPMDALREDGHQGIHVSGVRWWRRVKHEPAALVLGKHAVEHERVRVHVHIECRPEALNDGHGAATAVPNPCSARARRRSQPRTARMKTPTTARVSP
jgi:hypothetical protein